MIRSINEEDKDLSAWSVCSILRRVVRHNRDVARSNSARAALILSTAVLLAACSTAYSAKDQQVIYIPTDNGVRTELASIGGGAAIETGERPENGEAIEGANLIAGLEFQGPVGLALDQLLRYEIGSRACLGRHYSVTTGGADFPAAFKCFDDVELPQDCAGLRYPIGKLLYLAVNDISYDALLPALIRLQTKCRLGRTDFAHLGDSPERSILDIAIVFGPGGGQRVAPEHYLTTHFTNRLCEQVIEASSDKARLADLFLCSGSGSGGPQRGRTFYIDRILLLGERYEDAK